jgi:hypothetical protein
MFWISMESIHTLSQSILQPGVDLWCSSTNPPCLLSLSHRTWTHRSSCGAVCPGSEEQQLKLQNEVSVVSNSSGIVVKPVSKFVMLGLSSDVPCDGSVGFTLAQSLIWAMLLPGPSILSLVLGVWYCPQWTYLFLFLIFCSTGVWIQGLHLELLHQPFFVMCFFQDRVL